MKNPIRIGMPIPLTGVYSIEAEEQMRCAQIAIQEFNNSGGLGGRLAEVLVRDTKQNPDLARDMAIELIEKDKVDFVAGALSALDMMIIGKACTERKIVFNGLSIGDGVVAKENRSKYIFHEGPSAFGSAGAMARYAFSHFGFKVALLLVNHPFGIDSGRAIKNVGNQIDVNFVCTELPAFGEKDFKPFLERVRAHKPEVMISVNFGSDQFNMLTAIEELGMKNEMQVVCTYLSIPQRMKAGPELYKDIVGTTGYYWRLEEKYESAKKFNSSFVQAHGGMPPAAHGSYAYCAVKAMLDAVKWAGSTESDKLIEGMEALRFDYCRGPQFYRHLDHQSVQPVIVVESKTAEQMQSPHDVFNILEVSEFLGPRAFHISHDTI